MKIRFRTRRGYVKEAQGYSSWDEWQVVEGRKVVARFDHEHEAQKYAEEHEAKS